MDNRRILINGNNLLLFFILLLTIFPVIKIMGFELPAFYLLLPIGFFCLFILLLGKIKGPGIVKTIIIIFLLILIEIFLSTLYGTISILNNFDFPTDAAQYFFRFIVIISSIVYAYNGKINLDIFIKYFLIILNLGMLIGVLQWIPWGGKEFFIKLYPYYDLTKQLTTMRVHGLAQHATANGGLATFFFVFGYSIFKYYKKYKSLSFSLIILSIINIFISQARAGVLSLVSAIIIFYFLDIYINRKSFKPTIKLSVIFVFSFFWLTQLYKNGNTLVQSMVYRWNVLFETQGGVRIDQIYYFIDLLKSPMQYLFGLSKQVINQSLYSFGVEIEPINIFVTYGLIGFLLQYLLIFLLLMYFLRNMRGAISNKGILALIVASFVGLLSYQIFSIGFYFYREVRVGHFPWILMGITIGFLELYKRNNKSNKIV